MKTSSLLSTLTFLVFAFATFSFPGPVSSQTTTLSEKVYDILGAQLQAGAKYYVFQYPIVDEVHAVSLDKSCDVVLVSSKTFPMTFTPFNSASDTFIDTSLDLNVKFLSDHGCKKSSTAWTLTAWTNEFSVTAGGIEGDHGPQTWANWFQIVKVHGDKTNENLYSFRFCPPFAGQNCCKCKNVGIVERDGVKHLALTETALQVVFQRIDPPNLAVKQEK